MIVIKNTASRALVVTAMMLSFLLTAAAVKANALSTAGADTVSSLYDALLANMRSGPALGARGRYTRIEPVVRRSFDMPFMTRLTVGPEWERLNVAQRQHISPAFQRYISPGYADQFRSCP